MKANIPKAPKPPRAWQTLPVYQKKQIEEYALSIAREQNEKDARIILDLYTKMTVCVLHDAHNMTEEELICFLGNHKRLFQRHARMVREGTQLDYFNKRMAEIFQKSGFPQQFFDDMLGTVEEPVFDEQATGKVDNLEYTLCGVMHSVDKWLEGDELKQDEVNRAITMREKTLRIVENAKSEVERLEAELAKAKEKTERMQLNLEGVLEERAEYPTEIAREIFAEIDRAVDDAELEWGTIFGVKLCIAELKNKYIGGTTDESAG